MGCPDVLVIWVLTELEALVPSENMSKRTRAFCCDTGPELFGCGSPVGTRASEVSALGELKSSPLSKSILVALTEEAAPFDAGGAGSSS